MDSIEYKKIEDVASSGLFRYKNLKADNTFSIGEPPVLFYRDIIWSSLDGCEASYSIVTTDKREMVIDEAEQHFRTEEAIMPLDGDAVLFAGASGADLPKEWVAFLVPALTMVVFERGVWHKAPFSITGKLHSLVVLPPLTYLNDCRVVRLDVPISITRGCV